MTPRHCTADLGIDLDDAPSTRKNNLPPLTTPPVADDDDDALQQQTLRSHGKAARRNSGTKTTLSKAKMPKSMSMLEMNDIQDMRLFGEEMNALSAEPTVAATTADESQDDDEGGFFIEELSDRSDDSADQAAAVSAATTNNNNFLNNVYSESPDRTFHIPSSGGRMRRVMSMASLPSKKFGPGNLQVAPMIHTISEHATEEDDIIQEAMRSRTSEVELDASTNLRKPLSRQNSSSSMASGAMPRRSSMKGSRNNLLRATMDSDVSQAQTSQACGRDGSINRRRRSSRSYGLPRNLSRSSLRGSGNSSVGICEDASQVQASLDGSINGRRPSRSSRLSRRLSRSNLRGSGNSSAGINVHSSLNSYASALSMDDTNHSLDSNNDGDANIDDSTHTAQSASNNMKRNVSFASLEIRTYNVTLGDAPTSKGPPVSLSWEYDPAATKEHAIDHYENYRTAEAPRRKPHEMLMPASHRQYLLMREAGFSRGEIKIAMGEAQRCAKQREKTAKGLKLGLQPVEEVMERTKRMLSFRKKR